MCYSSPGGTESKKYVFKGEIHTEHNTISWSGEKIIHHLRILLLGSQAWVLVGCCVEIYLEYGL